MASCRAFVVTTMEEFGIAAVEAQAAGRPVIARGGGGLLETVLEGVTGCFWEGGADELAEAVARFDARAVDPQDCVENAAPLRHARVPRGAAARGRRRAARTPEEREHGDGRMHAGAARRKAGGPVRCTTRGAAAGSRPGATPRSAAVAPSRAQQRCQLAALAGAGRRASRFSTRRSAKVSELKQVVEPRAPAPAALSHDSRRRSASSSNGSPPKTRRDECAAAVHHPRGRPEGGVTPASPARRPSSRSSRVHEGRARRRGRAAGAGPCAPRRQDATAQPTARGSPRAPRLGARRQRMGEDGARHERVPDQGEAARLVLRVVLSRAVGPQDQRRDQPLGIAQRLARGGGQGGVEQLHVGVEEHRDRALDEREPGVHAAPEADVVSELEHLRPAALPAARAAPLRRRTSPSRPRRPGRPEDGAEARRAASRAPASESCSTVTIASSAPGRVLAAARARAAPGAAPRRARRSAPASRARRGAARPRRARPRPSALAAAGSESTSTSAAAAAAALPGSIRASAARLEDLGGPHARGATTGRPLAIASATTMPYGSASAQWSRQSARRARARGPRRGPPGRPGRAGPAAPRAAAEAPSAPGPGARSALPRAARAARAAHVRRGRSPREPGPGASKARPRRAPARYSGRSAASSRGAEALQVDARAHDAEPGAERALGIEVARHALRQRHDQRRTRGRGAHGARHQRAGKQVVVLEQHRHAGSARQRGRHRHAGAHPPGDHGVGLARSRSAHAAPRRAPRA